jgi:hypothetical protein
MRKFAIRFIILGSAVVALMLILVTGATAKWLRAPTAQTTLEGWLLVTTLSISVDPADVCTDGVIFGFADNRTRSYNVRFFVKGQGPAGTPVGTTLGISMQEGQIDRSQPICNDPAIDPSTGVKTCGLFPIQWTMPLAVGTPLEMWVEDVNTGPLNHASPFPAPETGHEIVVGSCKASQPFPAFTYVGRLTDGEKLASGAYDFRFSLYAARVGGGQVASTFERNALEVTDGLFTALLNFDSGLLTEPLWVEVEARPAGSTDPYTIAGSRQPLTAAPLAINTLYDSLSDLACAAGDVATWDGEAWSCGKSGSGRSNVVLLPAAGELAGYSAGDVLIIDTEGKVKKSDQANSTTVAGIYSPEMAAASAAAPVNPAPIPGDQVPVALWGVVPAKVNGPVRPGDLLVTATNGYARKAGANPAPGTILGKALGSVSSYNSGLIDVLVLLQ